MRDRKGPRHMSPSELQTLFAAVVCRLLREGEWRLVAVQALATLPPPLQADLRRTFALEDAAVVLLFEPEGPVVP